MKRTKIGDNFTQSDENLWEHVACVANLEDQISALRGDLKERLNKAKDEGFLKLAIRRAVKELRMTSEQLQAHKEVEAEVLRITELCRDLPLFEAA